MGGVVSDDARDSHKPKNADYWFPPHGVVVELKSLSADLLKSQDWNEHVAELYASWVSRGIVPPAPEGTKLRLNLQSIPRECAVDVLNYIRRRLERHVEEANAQIKATKVTLGLRDATGLLLIANEGDYGAKLSAVMNSLARCLRVECTSINSVIYFSVNMRVAVPNRAENAMFWADPDIPGREPVPRDFRQRLREAFFARVGRLVPGGVYRVDAETSFEHVDGVVFE
jgi:hypothetical protein